MENELTKQYFEFNKLEAFDFENKYTFDYVRWLEDKVRTLRKYLTEEYERQERVLVYENKNQ